MYSGSQEITDKSNVTVLNNDINIIKLLSYIYLFLKTANIIIDALIHKLSKALAVLLENLDSAKAIDLYRINLLVAVKLQNQFTYALDADVTVFEILGGASFNDVGALVAGRSRVVTDVLRNADKGQKQGWIDVQWVKEQWQTEDG